MFVTTRRMYVNKLFFHMYLDDKVRRRINGSNSRMVSVITDIPKKQETTEEKCTFNLVRSIE